jgi:hypothetical protein
LKYVAMMLKIDLRREIQSHGELERVWRKSVGGGGRGSLYRQRRAGRSPAVS